MEDWKPAFETWLRAFEANDAEGIQAAKKVLLGLRMEPGLLDAVIDLLPVDEERRRNRICSLLSDLAGKEHLPRLLPLLRHPEAGIRHAAVNAIGIMDAWDVTLEHILPLASDPDKQVRATTIYSLHFSDDPRACAVLIDALRSDPSAKVRESAAYGLWGSKCEGREAALIAALEDSEERVRKEACMTLGYDGLSGATDALRRVLHEDSSAQVRSRAARSLADFGCSDELPEMQRQYEEESDVECRLELARALITLDDERPWPWLLSLARKTSNSKVANQLDLVLRAMARNPTVELARDGLRVLLQRGNEGAFGEAWYSGSVVRSLQRLDERFGKETP